MKRGKGLRIGLIGCGSMGKFYSRLIPTLPGAKLSAVSDLDPQLAEETGRTHGVPFYTDFSHLMPDIEAVCIVTPAKTHFSIASACLEAGKHVLLEKPFTGSSLLAQDLIKLAKSKSLILAASFLERFNPAFSKLLKLIKGEKLHGIDIKRFSPFPERISDANVIFDMMIHDLDLLNCITQDLITDIKAEGEKLRTKMLDRVVASFTHQSGIISRVHANRVYSSKVRSVTVTTEKELIEADLLNKRIYIRDFSSPQPSTVPLRDCNQLFEQLKGFVKACKNLGPFHIEAEAAVRALTLAEEVEKLC